MLKAAIITFAVIIGSMLIVNHALDNGEVLRYIDTHPNPRWVPPVAFYLGQGYSAFNDLPEATTYFIRVVDQYPTSDYADDAMAAYLDCLDKTMMGRAQLIEENQKYVERFPNGKHIQLIQNRIDNYKYR